MKIRVLLRAVAVLVIITILILLTVPAPSPDWYDKSKPAKVEGEFGRMNNGL